MGLDIVEFVMEIEEEFDIRLPDDEAEQIKTLGNLHSFIHTQRGTRTDMGYCASSRAFYRLRRELMRAFGVERHRVTTVTPMGALMPREARAQHWARLGQRLGGWEMPPLQRPRWALRVLTLSGLGMLTSVILCVFMIHANGPVWVSALGFVFWAAVLFLTARLTEPIAIELPASCATMRGTVEVLLRRNYGRLVTEERGLQQDEVWVKVCDIVSEYFGVNRDELTPDTRIQEDLGAE
jgi:acyl carrier protein